MGQYREVSGVLSGVITIDTAGTAEQGPSTNQEFVALVKAYPSNTDTVWVGSDGSGDVSSSNGFPLDPGEAISIPGDLSKYWFDADVSGEKISWILVQR